MVQDAPLSGVTLTVPFLARLAKEVPLASYFKIEKPGTAAKLRALIAAGPRPSSARSTAKRRSR